MDFWRTVSGLARLYPYFEGCTACVGLHTTVLGFNGFKVMLGSRLVASCRTSACQQRPVRCSLHCTSDGKAKVNLADKHTITACKCSRTFQIIRPSMGPLLGPTPD